MIRALLLLLTGTLTAAELTVDCAQPAGTIRPLHGVNNGPLTYASTVDLTARHREIGVPFNRLHDSRYLQPETVDIHCVFPDFRADPEKPESYFFGPTDELLASIRDSGARVVYRLGESIEHGKRKYWVHPPVDFAKWAQICVGIVRHYNEGWAGGMQLGITHWEIWNEPENRPAMWSGSDEDYFRLYEVTAKALKTRWPALKIGGPAVGSTGVNEDGATKPTKFVAGFLDHCRAHGVPLDFFSWHRYPDDPHTIVTRAREIRQWLDERGFTKTESHLNEWNWLPEKDWGPILPQGLGEKREQTYARIGGAEGAAFTAVALAELHDAPLDVACYYTADVQGFGMFSLHGVPKKPFHAFRAFRALLDTPQRVAASGGIDGKLALLAGTNAEKSEARILVANFRAEGKAHTLVVKNLPWDGATDCEIQLLDATRDLATVRREKLPEGYLTLTLDLPPATVALVKLRR